MRKKLLFITLLSLGIVTSVNSQTVTMNNSEFTTQLQFNQLKYGNNQIAVGNLNISTTETIKLSPDIAEFSITYITEGGTPNDASNRNSNNMKTLTKFMEELGVTSKDLTTINYRNYTQNVQQPINNINNKQYQTTLTIHVTLSTMQFYKTVTLLENHHINTLKQNRSSNNQQNYSFTISTSGNDDELVKQTVKNKYDQIYKELLQLGISNIIIQDYENKTLSPTTESVKKYYVHNTVKIKVTNFDNLGKIIAKAQELKMTINNDISYRVSDATKELIMEQYEQKIYAKLLAKAQRLLTQQPYRIGAPITLNFTQNILNQYNTARKDYGYNSSILNSGQKQSFVAEDIEINPPSEYEITLSISGTFEVIQTTAVSM